MPPPRELHDALESVLSVFFSDVRHRERAAFLLCDELVEMTCKVKHKEHCRDTNAQYPKRLDFPDALNAAGVTLPNGVLKTALLDSHRHRNLMQHESAAATVDDRYCADAIVDALALMEHCWPGSTSSGLHPWVKCAIRVVRLYSSQGDFAARSNFEAAMRKQPWRARPAQVKVNEVAIEPGLRRHWGYLFLHATQGVTGILDAQGIP